jgi:hypothetical protein
MSKYLKINIFSKIAVSEDTNGGRNECLVSCISPLVSISDFSLHPTDLLEI